MARATLDIMADIRTMRLVNTAQVVAASMEAGERAEVVRVARAVRYAHQTQDPEVIGYANDMFERVIAGLPTRRYDLLHKQYQALS